MLTDRPTLSNDREHLYLQWWEWAVENLEQLLDLERGQLSGKAQALGLARLLWRARSTYFAGNPDGAKDLAHVVNLAEDLDALQTANAPLFNDYKAKLLSNKARQSSYLTGVWFEIRVAERLINCGLNFNQPDPPDFEIIFGEEKIGLECHAPRVTQGQDVKKRLQNAVFRKQRDYYHQDWFQGTAVLALDATWMLRADAGDSVQGQDVAINVREGLQATLKKSRFDLIIALWYGHAKDIDHRTTTCVYAPTENEDKVISVFLKRFLAGFQQRDNLEILLPRLPE